MHTITEHNRVSWSRMAKDAYANGRNEVGHKMSVAATRSYMSATEYAEIFSAYCQWLAFGWKG